MRLRLCCLPPPHALPACCDVDVSELAGPVLTPGPQYLLFPQLFFMVRSLSGRPPLPSLPYPTCCSRPGTVLLFLAARQTPERCGAATCLSLLSVPFAGLMRAESAASVCAVSPMPQAGPGDCSGSASVCSLRDTAERAALAACPCPSGSVPTLTCLSVWLFPHPACELPEAPAAAVFGACSSARRSANLPRRCLANLVSSQTCQREIHFKTTCGLKRI